MFLKRKLYLNTKTIIQEIINLFDTSVTPVLGQLLDSLVGFLYVFLSKQPHSGFWDYI